MKYLLLLFLISIFLIYSCNSSGKKVRIIVKNEDNIIDTSQIERKLDSLFHITNTNENYGYIIKLDTEFSESDIIEHWLFDSLFNFIRYENVWQGEGYIGHGIQGFHEQRLIFKIDTTNDSYSEEICHLHSGLNNIKGVKTTYIYKIEDNIIFIKPRTPIKESNIEKINKVILNQDDFNTIEKRSLYNLENLKLMIREAKDSVIFEKGIVKINKMDYRKTIKCQIDSLLYVNIICDSIK